MHSRGGPLVGTKGSLPWRPWFASVWAARLCHGLDVFVGRSDGRCGATGCFLYYSYVCKVKTMNFGSVGSGREPRAGKDLLTRILVKYLP